MKHIFIFSFSLLALVSNAQRNYHAFDVLGGLVVPPNGILVADNIFLDDSEVMNSHYLEYLHFLAQDSSEQALVKAYPDTSIFGRRHLDKLVAEKRAYYKKKGDKHIPMRLPSHEEEKREPLHKHHWWNYFSYHGTKHHPVVGITYEQAMAYCKWRSEFVTALFNNVLKKKKKYKTFENKFVSFEFSLPDEKTWELAAHELASKSMSDSLFKANVKTINQEKRNEPVAVFDNTPTSSGFYNLMGNVAEMLLEKGKSKGGSYLQNLDDCAISKTIFYDKPERWLGFRCMCVVRIENLNN